MSTSAGRVLIIPKGDYNAATTYTMLDMVYYNGSSYVCKQPSTGNLPTNTTYWQPMTGDISGKMDKANPTGTGSFSLNRKASTTVGSYSFAEGSNCTASGDYSHAEGASTTASEMYSHAEGTSTIASAMAAHAEGESTHATGSYSHAENTMTQATGYASHSEGDHTLASGDQSHAEGFYTQAGYDNQHVSGIYNDNKATTLFEVGNGESGFNRSNAFEVYSDGSISTDNGTTKVKLENLVSQSQALTNQLEDEAETRSALGAKNLLPCKATDFSATGITCTVNSDGTVDVVADGSSTSGKYYEYFAANSAEEYPLEAGKTYIISGCPSGDATKYFLHMEMNGATIVNDTGSGATFVAPAFNTLFTVHIRIVKEQSFNVTFKPMIRLATDADPTYQPYAKTNVELTQESAINGITITLNSDNFATTSGTLQNGSVKLVTVGGQLVNIEYMDIRLSSVDANTNPTITITDDKLLAVSAFNETIPPTLRGADQSPVISNGGYCSHANNTNTMTIGFFNYIGTKPAGFLQILK